MGTVTNIDRIEASGGSAAEQRNAALAQKIIEGFSRGDFDVLYSNMIEGAEQEVIGLYPEKLGKHAENPDFISDLFSNGMDFTVKRVAIDRSIVCVEWDDHAETSTGQSYSNQGMSVFTFNDEGKVASYREYFDPFKFYEVL
jgi:ketosteroid isomerase-like protein